MTDIGPQQVLGTNFPTTPLFGQQPTSGPIITSLPSTTKSLNTKYNKLAPILQGLPQPIVNSLYQYDSARANRGAQPLSDKQTAAILAAALTGQATTPPADRGHGVGNLLGNAVHDLGNIVAAVPRLPVALYHEVQALPQAPADIQAALGAGSPSKVVTALTEAPGVRLIPGAQTAHSIASGHAEQLLQHPLMTLLDLYPAAKEVGLTAKLGEQTAVIGGKLAATDIGSDLALRFRGNPAVQYAQQAFGRQARDLSAETAHRTAQLGRDVAAHDSMGLTATYGSLPEADRIAATQAIELGTIDQLPDNLQAFAREAQIQANLVSDVATTTNDLAKAPYGRGNGDTNIEYLDPQTFAKYSRRQRLATVAVKEGQLRKLITDPTSSTIDEVTQIGADAATTDASMFADTQSKVRYLEGVTHAIDSLGYDATPLRTMVRSMLGPKSLRPTSEELTAAFNDFPSNATKLPEVPDAATIKEMFTPAGRRDPKMAVFLDNLKNGNYREAYDAAKTIDKRTTFRPDDWDQIVESVKRQRTQQNYLTKPPVFSDSMVNKALRREQDFVQRNAPAKYGPLIVKRAEDKVLAGFVNHPDFPAITQAISERNYSQYPGLADEMSKSIRGIERTWQDIRDEGHDIGFISHVTPESINNTLHPTVVPRNITESWTKKRTLDVSPYIPDATVVVPHMAMETLKKVASESYVNDYIVPSFVRMGETEFNGKSALLEDFLPAARRRYPNNPELVRQEAERLMRKEYIAFNPDTFLGRTPSKLTNLGTDKMWIPKNVMRNLERMQTPIRNGFTAVMDPVMNAFRMSVLGFSPRFQVNNIVGGGILAAAEDPGILAYLSRATSAIRGELDPELAAVADKIGIGTGLGQIPRESLEWKQLQANTLFQNASGKTLRRLFDSAQKGRELASGIVDKSFQANAFIDDMYRAAAYMRGESKALAKGMSAEEASAAGVDLSRKILQKWDQMTPIERTVIRYVFPFYGWAAHIVPYVLKYPFDHPWRASIMSNITKNEISDMGSGLPERFLNAFFLGHPDKSGNIKAIQTGGLNPFTGVSNYFTWAGFASNVNPVVGSILEALGVDKQSGSAELYPDLQYDPETGRLVTKGKSFLPSLLSNLVPQSQILTDLFGASSDFKSLMKSDPQAAARRLLSEGGLPLLYRQYNLPQEQFKAELARQNNQTTAKSNALKSGNLDSLNKYPALRGYVAQMKALQEQGLLAPYTPANTGPSTAVAVQQALTP